MVKAARAEYRLWGEIAAPGTSSSGRRAPMPPKRVRPVI